MAKVTCSVAGCEGGTRIICGMCTKHYQRWKKHGDPLVVLIGPENRRLCSLDGCQKPHKGHGFCEMHLERWRKHGDPHNSGVPTLEERLWRKVDRITDAPCWRWTGGATMAGYGLVSVNGRFRLAHRTMYELSVGPIPTGLEIDHLCFNKRCVNPAHLEAVTPAENSRRAWAAGRRQKVT